MLCKTLYAAALVGCTLTAAAQDPTTTQVTTNFKDTVSVKKDTTYWQKSITGGINLNQASFSNWVGGGVNSIAIGGVVAARALYEKGKTSWDNTADFQLGYITQRGVTRKSSDQLIIISVVGHKIAPKWDLFASGTFNSFFAPGFVYDKLPAGRSDFKVSSFFAPAQLTLAWGVAYKPNDEFSLRLSPFAPRFTFLADDAVRYRTGADGVIIPDPTAKAYGVEAGKSSRSEWLSLQLQAVWNKKLSENISLNARYQLYANYQTLSAIDHRVDLLLTAKLNRYLSTTFGVIALYDKDFFDGLQIQQSLGIGLIYNASTFRKK
ncbi:hypothetical protein FAES_0916 [Fibrella aestuarina BUZ 2]|uniref:DUF3078 domain-containing protein n=1 Tax=Fibrella aestuarina BUZ 2 TaxID=1166018 RepID=I0K474_9BACT|nr:DUF3078 domain-containing protein [Fibrella aestuarina]CCG98927.1 hypothetical protein FAES_0916 [Fibrella aestuarina BUZ 2]